MGRSREDSEGKGNLKCHEETVSRNQDFEEGAGDSLKGSKTYVPGNWQKGESCFVAAECLATLSPTVM